jgi:hypothetical protein
MKASRDKEAKLTAERLRELLNYDPETGVFTWRVSRRATARPGSVAGTITPKGYRNIWIGGNYRAHRLAWLYVHGKWPDHEIDHIDGNRANNAIANLRDVTRSVNHENLRCARSDNAHGLLGVSPSKGKRWKTSITVNGKWQHLGTFKTPEEAHAAYLEAKRRLHVGCTI